MTIDLRIHRLRGHYRVLDPQAAAPQVQQRLDAIVRRQLRDAVDLLLPGVIAELGIDPQAEVVVRQLRVRIRILDSEQADEDIGVAWARAIAQALRSTLTPVAGGGETEDAAVLPGRMAAEQRWLAGRVAGKPSPWWVLPLLGTGGQLPDPAAVMARWVRTAPEAAPAALIDLARTAPRGLAELLTPAQARALVQVLAAAWALDVEGEPTGSVDPPARAAPPAGPLVAPTPAADRAAADRAAGVEHRLLIALASALARREPRRRWTTGALLATVAPVPAVPAVPLTAFDPVASSTPTGVTVPTPARGPAPAPLDPLDPAAGQPTAADGAVRPDEPTPPHLPIGQAGLEGGVLATGLPVELGGLLFLVRPLARASLVLDHDGSERLDLLRAVGWRALATLFDPLPLAARIAAWERHRALLGVFVGLDRLPDDLAAAPVGPALQARADAALGDLVQRLPASLQPLADGWRALYGSGRRPLDRAGPSGRLASLLLRPGRLRLTRTHADLDLPLRSVDSDLRAGGWDLDPGWVPHLGRVIRFHYEDPWT